MRRPPAKRYSTCALVDKCVNDVRKTISEAVGQISIESMSGADMSMNWSTQLCSSIRAGRDSDGRGDADSASRLNSQL